MSDIGRRLFVTVLGSGAFVWFDKNYQSGGNTGGNASNPDQTDIQLEGEVLSVTQDDATTDATVSVELDAVNYGTQDGSVFVEFTDQVEEIETRDVAVAAGELQPLTFSDIYTDVTESDVTLGVTNDPPQVKLTLPRPNIQFTSSEITDSNGNVITEIQEGQTFYVSGTAENVGDRQGTKDYVLYGDSSQLASTTVDLQPAGSTPIEFSHTFQSGDLDLASGESKPVNLSVNETDVGEISIFKPAIPDSAVEQWISTAYDATNDEWLGQIQGSNLTGGAATTDADANGNDVVVYDGSNGQQHSTTNINIPYGRWVVNVVFRSTDTSTQQYLFDSVNNKNIFQNNNNGTEYSLDMNLGKAGGGTVDSDLHLATVYGPEFGSENELLEIDGTTKISGTDLTDKPLDGFVLGGSSGDVVPFIGHVLETVVYDNPTQSEISEEQSRLSSAYDGLTT